MIPHTFDTYIGALNYKRVLNRLGFDWVIKPAPKGWRVTTIDGRVA